MGEMKDRMLRGELYRWADDPDLIADNAAAQVLVEAFNATPHAQGERRAELLRELLGEIAPDATILPPFHCDYGAQISLGERSFINYGCVMLDCAPIRIGARCWIATNVQLLTATHPIGLEARSALWEYALPITIGDDVWLGGGVIVCPGVTIGEGTVVGAGSVVTRDLPAGVVAVGNPARVLREIGPEDRAIPPA
ncbi:MAG: sugar O-acetyltransferase [Solirubrobacteraceae bacterium]|nr:sugar O-acetyltransferase [Solirubrobacteraceae bacterium]